MTRKPLNEKDVERILEEAALPDRPRMDDATTAHFLSLIRKEAAACTRYKAYKRVARRAAAVAVLAVCAVLLYRQPAPSIPAGQEEPVTIVRAGGGEVGEAETICEQPALLMGGDAPARSDRATDDEETRPHHPERQGDTLPAKLKKIFSELLRLPGREG